MASGFNGNSAAGACWQPSRGRSVSLEQPVIVGIVNVTPDSFADGGRYADASAAAGVAAEMIRHGAAGVDIGGESTRPGSTSVPVDVQVARVVPVIEQVRRLVGDGPFISVDTTRAAVASAALQAGADAVNDISAGQDDAAMLGVVAASGAGLVLMHRLKRPAQDAYSHQYGAPSAPPAPRYGDVVTEVAAFLEARAEVAIAAGIAPASILIDPGLGFGKTPEDNLRLIARTREFVALGHGVMSGLSRKSFTGYASLPPGRATSEVPPPANRLPATLALSVVHLLAGARVFRVHDVPEHVAALSAAWRARAIAGAGGVG